MTACSYAQEYPSSVKLPRWATITQVSAALAVPRSTVRDTVRRAWAAGELWVKKEDVDYPYLIDTTHEVYQAHVQRWKAHQASREEEAILFSFSWHLSETGEEGALPWPLLRARLCARGVQVFRNGLAEADQEHPWHWRWGEQHGEGYPSLEEALMAALESQISLDPGEQAPAALSGPAPLVLPSEGASRPLRAHRRSLFGRPTQTPSR